MKKIIAILIALSVISGGAALAAPADVTDTSKNTTATETVSPSPEAEQLTEPAEAPAGDKQTPEPVPTPEEAATTDEAAAQAAVPEKELSKQFILTLDIAPRKYIISRNAIIELYDMNDNLLGSELMYVGWDTPQVTFTFDVPEYRMGTRFKVKLASGLRSLYYYDQGAAVGETIEVTTFGFINADGNYEQCNGASMTGNPDFEKEMHVYITNQWYNDLNPRARLVDDVAMMPVRAVGNAMGLDVTYNPEWDSVTLSLEDQKAVFWANNEYMTYPGGDKNASHVPVYIEGSLFVPLRDLADAFGCSLEVTDYGEFIDILIGEAPYHQTIRNRIPVNRDGIGSKTNYLIWVSKHEYKVRVYEGQQYHWSLMKTFPCALGAWDTPTITGQFEILERTQWDYPGYYVGPVLRFYNGYALHSTLLNYGGGEYDGRVGVNISHGCVRLHPGDINWIARTVPFRTRVYITE